MPPPDTSPPPSAPAPREVAPAPREVAPAPGPRPVAARAPVRRASGRLAVLGAYAAAAAAVPVPFVPDRLIGRVRGAIAHDVASRHGLSLTSEAREALAAPTTDHGARAFAREATQLLTRRLLSRFGPARALGFAVRGLEVFALGHLFDRYLLEVRRTAAVRIHGGEARRLRAAIDRAVARAVSPALQPAAATLGTGVEDLRDELTRWIDSLLLTGAALPEYLVRRLDAAFDEVVEASPELHDE